MYRVTLKIQEDNEMAFSIGLRNLYFDMDFAMAADLGSSQT